MRGVRALLAAGLLAPLLAHADPTLLERIDEMGEQSRFVPDKALVQLLQVEPEARAADILTKAEFLTQLALTRGRLGQNDVALTLAAELVAYGTAVHSKAALAKGLLCEAYIRFALADVASAHRLAFEAEPLAEASGLEALRVQATITAGEAYAEQGNFPAAMVKLQRAVDMARPLENQLVLASALKSLAVLYDQVKEYEKGFAVLDELLDVARKLQSPGRLALAKNTEYALSIDSKQPKRALRALEEGLVLERQLGAQRMIANTLVNLSDSYLKQHDYARTLQYANQSLKVSQQSNDEATEATANINIGEAYLGLGRIAEGRRSFEAGMAFYEKANSQPDLQAMLSNMDRRWNGPATWAARWRPITASATSPTRCLKNSAASRSWSCRKNTRRRRSSARSSCSAARTRSRARRSTTAACSSACGGCWPWCSRWRPSSSACCTARCATPTRSWR